MTLKVHTALAIVGLSSDNPALVSQKDRQTEETVTRVYFPIYSIKH